MKVRHYDHKRQTFSKAVGTVYDIITYIQKSEREGYMLDTGSYDQGLEIDTEGITVHMKRRVEYNLTPETPEACCCGRALITIGSAASSIVCCGCETLPSRCLCKNFEAVT